MSIGSPPQRKSWAALALTSSVAVACGPTSFGDPSDRPEPPPEIQPIRFVEKAGTAVSSDMTEAARTYARDSMSAFGPTDQSDFLVLGHKKGKDGLDHIRLQQTHLGVPVYSADVVVHASADEFLHMGGRLGVGIDSMDVDPSLAGSEALAVAQAEYASAAKSQSGLVYDRVKTELVLMPTESRGMHLAWHVQFFTELQAGVEPGLWNYFIDAEDGSVHRKFNGLDTLSQASGPGGNPKVARTWVDALDVENSGAQFKSETARLVTTDMNNSTSGSGTVVVGPLDDFGDAPINDAHGFAEVTLNMMLDWTGHDSIDDNGFIIRSRVHYGTNYENAFWDGTQMTYGDGASFFYPLSGDIDVVAHEINHGFTTFHSNLIYSQQSGGLNESFSDIAGTMAEFYNEGAAADWDLGADIFQQANGALRFMCDPTADGNSIDHFSDYTNGIDVHFSSGISNKAFCRTARRLATGDPDGTATPDSVRRAGEAWFEANASYWSTGTSFEQGCQGTIDAANALGFTVDEIAAISDSWNDVGVFCTGPAPILCDETSTAESGTITSPNHPAPYPNNVNFTWCIEPASGQPATLTFDAFDTEANFDFVRVRDANGDELSNTSGSTAPADAVSTVVVVTFTSDASVTRTGFSASWSTGGMTNEPPTVTITEPSDGATVSGDVAISASAADSDGSVDRVIFSLPDGTTVEDSSAPYSTIWDSSSSADGAGHVIKAQAIDDLGAASDEVMVTVSVANGNECATGSYGINADLSIPDNNATGITSTQTVAGGGTLSSVVVSLDITHTWRGDLIVTLTSPSGTSVVLHNRSGGSADNVVLTGVAVSSFDGESAAGDWSLVVQDMARQDLGTLNDWTIDLIADCGGNGGGDWSASASPDLALVDNGTVCTTVTVVGDGNAAEVEVDLMGQHDWRSILRATLEHDGFTSVVFGTGTFPTNRGEFSLSDHAVSGFSGDASGDWTLCIEDTDAFGDTGTLQAWSVHN